VNNDNNIDSINWSDWLDFNKNTIDNIPESEGVYKMHASMKILYIGSSYNLKQSLLELLSHSCISNKPARFSYALTESSNKIKEFLLDEYRNKHNGKLPLCMES
jgi:excinuclease UvrABC nuclease subunit